MADLDKRTLDQVKIPTVFDVKDSVKVASTGNLTLSGEQTIDGVLTSKSRVLVKDQTLGEENGIYITSSGAWSRSEDANNNEKLTSSMYLWIEEGTVNADQGFVITTNNPITLNTTSLTFTQFTGTGQITAGTGLTKTANTINAIGTAGNIVANADSLDIGANVLTDSSVHTLTNKTINADGAGNSITNIEDADIKAGAAIALSKLATDPLARANHTGTQTVSTISDYATALATFTNKTINTASNTLTVVEADISDLQAYLLDVTGEPIGDLSDVTITAVDSGEIIKWSGTAWINNTLAEAGISATGHTHIEADITDLQSYLLNITGEAIGSLSDVTNTTPADAHLFLFDSVTSKYENQAISGDVTVTKDGVTAIGATKVTDGMLAGSISNTKLATNPLARANHTGTQTLTTISDVTMTAANLNILDDAGDTALHYHTADRARANHTGTQIASTISDFDTQVRTSTLNQMATPTTDLAIGTNKITGVVDPAAAQDAATKNYVDTEIATALTSDISLKGDYNASTNSPDLDTTPIAITKGDHYVTSVAGTFFTIPLEVGDSIISKQDTPTLESHWIVAQANLTPATIKTQYESNANTNSVTDAEKTVIGNTSGTNTGDEVAASTTVEGVSELATIAEVDTGTDAVRTITPSGLAGSALQIKVNGITAGANALTSNSLSQFAATTSSQLAGVISDETGSGALVFGTSPTLVTPALGTPASGVATNITGLVATTGLTATGTKDATTFLRGDNTWAVVSGYDTPTIGSTPITSGSTNTTIAGLTLTSPTLTAPILGTITSGDGSALTGTAASFTAGNVTNNANSIGDVTSVGNTTTIAAGAVDVAMLANGVDGELITWSATGAPTTVAVGTATHVLTSNGIGVAPTFQAAAGGGGKALLGADSTSVTVVGTTATQVKDIDFIKNAATIDAQTLTVAVRIKTSNASTTANIRFRLDGSGTDSLVLTTISTAFEVKTGTIDVSALSSDRHTVEVYMDDGVGHTVTMDMTEFWAE